MTIASRFSPYKVQIFEPVPLAGNRGIRLPKSAEIRFFQPGDTFTPKDVYSTEADAIAGTNSLGNTVKANALGQLPEVWFTDAVRAIAYIENANGQMVDLPGWDIDNLGSGGDLVIRLWDSVTTFSENDYAVGPDFNLYVSKVANNLNNDPVGDYTNWRPSGSWVSRVSGYSSGEWAWHNGKWWYSTANTNTNAPGGANWLSPADNLFNALTIPATDSFIQVDASASTAEYSQLFKPDKDNERVILASSSSPADGDPQLASLYIQKANGDPLFRHGYFNSVDYQHVVDMPGSNAVFFTKDTAGNYVNWLISDPDALTATFLVPTVTSSNTTVTSMGADEFITLANGEKISLRNLLMQLDTFYTDNDLAFALTQTTGATQYWNNNTGGNVYIYKNTASQTIFIHTGTVGSTLATLQPASLSGGGSGFGQLYTAVSNAGTLQRQYPTNISVAGVDDLNIPIRVSNGEWVVFSGGGLYAFKAS